LVTIGESPREDVVPEIMMLLERQAECLIKGALDGLSRKQREKLRPGKTDFGLITRLKDGSTAVVGRKKIFPLLRKKIAEFESLDVRLVALLCTDKFRRLGRKFGTSGVVLHPYRILRSEVAERLKEGALGVFVPLENQRKEAKKKWAKAGRRVVVEALHPYVKAGKDLEEIERMRKGRIGLIVLDCIGYSGKTKVRIERLAGVPVLWPRESLANEIRKWIDARERKRNNNLEEGHGVKTGNGNRRFS